MFIVFGILFIWLIAMFTIFIRAFMLVAEMQSIDDNNDTVELGDE